MKYQNFISIIYSIDINQYLLFDVCFMLNEELNKVFPPIHLYNYILTQIWIYLNLLLSNIPVNKTFINDIHNIKKYKTLISIRNYTIKTTQILLKYLYNIKTQHFNKIKEKQINKKKEKINKTINDY